MDPKDQKLIESEAMSIRPGEAPPGQYIGSIFRVGLEFQIFRDSSGAYWYRRFPEYDPRKKRIKKRSKKGMSVRGAPGAQKG